MSCVIPSAAAIFLALLAPLCIFLFVIFPAMIGVKCLAAVRGTNAWSALLKYVLAYVVMIIAGIAIAIVTVLLREFASIVLPASGSFHLE